MQWSGEECGLKVRRGRRIALCTSTTEPYNPLLSKSVAKWREFHGDIFELGETLFSIINEWSRLQLYHWNRRTFYLKKKKLERIIK